MENNVPLSSRPLLLVGSALSLPAAPELVQICRLSPSPALLAPSLAEAGTLSCCTSAAVSFLRPEQMNDISSPVHVTQQAGLCATLLLDGVTETHFKNRLIYHDFAKFVQIHVE